MRKNVYVARGPGSDDVKLMLQMAGCNIIADVDVVRQVDLVVLVGGTDVHPYTYLHHKQRGESYDFERDVKEFKMVRACEQSGVPVVGICRGSQLLCIHNHGTLYQDVQGHCVNEHSAFGYTREGDLLEVKVNSTHHQVSNPNEEHGVVLLWGDCGSRHSSYNITGLPVDVTDDVPGYYNNDHRDAEVTWYPEHNQLGIQYHPEWMEVNSDGRKLAINLINDVVERRTPSIRI